MPVNITIRNVPDETRDVLARRAADAGQSMQEYLRTMLIEHTSKPTQREILDQIREFAPSLPPREDDRTGADIVREDRDAREAHLRQVHLEALARDRARAQREQHDA